jgi:ketosteroid isomerase-like protein
MTAATRTIAEAYYRASVSRDVETIAGLIAEDVDWIIQGPVDLFPFLGKRIGRAAVLQVYKTQAQVITVTGYEVEALVVEGDRSAALIRITARMNDTGRVLACRTSQFIRYRDGKICEMRGIIDTFDMVEQSLGRQIEVPLAPA